MGWKKNVIAANDFDRLWAVLETSHMARTGGVRSLFFHQRENEKRNSEKRRAEKYALCWRCI